MSFDETTISAAIIQGYHDKLMAQLTSDVIIVGAGPSGMVAAMDLADQGRSVTVVEKRLTPGGGIWGGAMAMNELVVQPEAVPLLKQLAVRHQPAGDGLLRTDSVELAAALTLHCVQKGAVILNMTNVEDICMHEQRVSGVVINRTSVSAPLPIDPLTLRSAVVVDATGHDAAVVQMVRRRGLTGGPVPAGEGPMNAVEGEHFVVDQTGEIYPGLWVCGMSVCAARGGPRMGPIFGGMLLSGRHCAEQIQKSLK